MYTKVMYKLRNVCACAFFSTVVVSSDLTGAVIRLFSVFFGIAVIKRTIFALVHLYIFLCVFLYIYIHFYQYDSV